jgi:hypothetical protein
MSNVAAAPALGVAGITFLGYPMAEWVQVLAAIWLIVQIVGYLWSRFSKRRGKQ